MDIAARFKMVRDSLGYSQREMAKKLDSSLGALQSYESGKSVPGGNVLEALARLRFNVNWILTGEGEMSNKPCGWWAERFKLLRGSMTFPEFAIKMNLIDPEKWVSTLQAIEEGRIEPSWGLMVVLQGELGISPNWMFGIWDAQILQADEDKFKNAELEPVLLKLIYEVIDDIDESRLLTSEQKAELFSLVYIMNARTKYTKERLKRFIEAVCSFIEQGIDFNKLSEQKLSNIIVEIAHHVVKGQE